MTGLAPAFAPRGDIEFCTQLRRQGAAGVALERSLHDLGLLMPGGWADWQASTLTPGGAPLLIEATDEGAGLGLRAEVADPAQGARGRLAEVLARVERLGGVPVPPALREILATAQDGGPLLWGARLDLWQSGRRRRAGLVVEWPEAAADLLPALVPAEVRLALARLGGARLVEVAHDPALGQTALRFARQGPHPCGTVALAEPARLDAGGLAGWMDRALPQVVTFVLRPNGLPPLLDLDLREAAPCPAALSHGTALSPIGARVLLSRGQAPRVVCRLAPDWTPLPDPR